MKILSSKFRSLSDNEIKKLLSVKKENEKNIKNTYKKKTYIILFLVSIISGMILYCFSNKFNKIFLGEFIGYVVGTLCVISTLLFFNLPLELIKDRKRLKKENNLIKSIIESNLIEVYEIETDSAIHFTQHDDEGELYLLKISEDKLLYIWDDQILIKKSKFPNTHFEIYKSIDVQWLLENKINYKGEKFSAKKVNAKTKSKYFQKEGFPENLQEITGTIEDVFNKISRY